MAPVLEGSKGAPAWLNSIQMAQLVGTVVKCRVSGMWALLWALPTLHAFLTAGLDRDFSHHRVSNGEQRRLSFSSLENV